MSEIIHINSFKEVKQPSGLLIMLPTDIRLAYEQQSMQSGILDAVCLSKACSEQLTHHHTIITSIMKTWQSTFAAGTDGLQQTQHKCHKYFNRNANLDCFSIQQYNCMYPVKLNWGNGTSLRRPIIDKGN
jgi:hypothetical protein